MARSNQSFMLCTPHHTQAPHHTHITFCSGLNSPDVLLFRILKIFTAKGFGRSGMNIHKETFFFSQRSASVKKYSGFTISATTWVYNLERPLWMDSVGPLKTSIVRGFPGGVWPGLGALTAVAWVQSRLGNQPKTNQQNKTKHSEEAMGISSKELLVFHPIFFFPFSSKT